MLLLEALDRLLPTEDADISRLVERGLKHQGIDVHTGTAGLGRAGGERHGVDLLTYGRSERPREVDHLVICRRARAPT